MGLRSEATAVEVDATESGGRARTAEGTAVPDGVLYRDDSIRGIQHQRRETLLRSTVCFVFIPFAQVVFLLGTQGNGFAT